LDHERRADPDLEKYFGDSSPEPVFIKNLETVQGDQRDVILLSIGYGPTTPEAKTMSMNFGPLNRQGGERRLNVAITRATTEVVVFASFDASMIDLTRTSAKAIHDLKHYLDFAERGPIALGEAVLSVGGSDSYDSDLEFTVAEGIRKFGWTVHTQVGVSKFRIDLGIVHPDKPGAYLAGVECDGAAYHSLPSARDRDRVRHIILERLGWRLLRIWSTDFFLDAHRVLIGVDNQLKAFLEADRVKAAAARANSSEVSSGEESSGGVYTEKTASEEIQPTLVSGAPGLDDSPASTEGKEEAPHTATEGSSIPFAVDNVGAIPPDLAKLVNSREFYEPTYAKVIADLAVFHIDTFGPITFKHLSERLARLHAFKRTGSEIKSLVWAQVKELRMQSRDPDGQTTLWPKGIDPQLTMNFRGLKIGQLDRTWSDIPYTEKLGLASEVLSQQGDPISILAERIGLGRLLPRTREQLNALLSEAAKRPAASSQ
jgi:very-short-patch-repair endonuclease